MNAFNQHISVPVAAFCAAIIIVLTSCGELNISKELKTVNSLERTVNIMNEEWSDFYDKAIFTDLDSMYRLCETLPSDEGLLAFDSLQQQQIFYWKEMQRRFTDFNQSYQQLFTNIKDLEIKLAQLEEDRINRSIQRERFYIYIKDEQRELNTVRQNLDITLKALNDCYQSFSKYGSNLVKLSEQSVS